MLSLKEWCIQNNRLEILNKWSEENNISPSEVSYGSSTIVLWKCENDHTWKATINKMTNRKSLGCPYCSNQKVWRGFNDLQSKRPDIAAEWHPTKNGDLHSCDVTVHSNKTFWWLCPLGHEYQATANSRTREDRKRGCPYCAHKRLKKGFNDLATICPKIAAEWHPTLNKGLNATDVLASSSLKVWWKCSVGHDYLMSLNVRVLNGNPRNGCPICANKIIIAGCNDLKTLFPTIAKEWDRNKNANLLPSQVLPGTHKKYWWICPFGHSYQASPENRTMTNGTGCPVCAKEQQSSFPEQAIFFYLKQQFSNVQNRAMVFDKEIDIFIPEINVGIEYDGYRWHTKETRSREEQKDVFLYNKGITIIRIKEYREKNDIEQLPNTIWINGRGNQYNNIKYAIKEIVKRLNFQSNFVIDLDADSIRIMEMYISSKKNNSLAFLRPDVAKDWDKEKNGTISQEQVSVHSGKKFWWKCSLNHNYQMTVDARTGRNAGCPYCAGQRVLAGFNDLKTRFPIIAAEWHPSNNGELTPESVMPGSRMKVWWICSKGHEYSAAISGRTSGKSGCPYCSGLKVINGETDLKTLFPEIAKEWNKEKNGALSPDSVKPFSHRKVWWICPKGHNYETAISDRTNNYGNSKGNGCPYCSGRRILRGFNDLKTLFPEIANKWHPTLNGDLYPDMVQPYSTKKVWWIDDNGQAIMRRIDAVVSGYVKKRRSNGN